MSGQGPGGSVASRAWAWLIGGFVFLVLLQVLVAMVVEVLPWLVAAGVVGMVVVAWNRWRWR